MATDAPLRFFSSFAHLRICIQTGLEDAEVVSGLDVHYIFDCGHEQATELASELGGGIEDADALVALWNETESQAVGRVAFLSRFTSADAETHVLQLERARERKRLRTDVTSHVPVGRVSNVCSATGKSGIQWPSKLRRKLAAAGGAEARADVEAKERARWVAELQSMIRHARLPIVSVA